MRTRKIPSIEEQAQGLLTYAKLAVPVPPEEAQARIDKFINEVLRLRIECKVPNVVVAASVNVPDADPDTGQNQEVGATWTGSPSDAAYLSRKAYDLYAAPYIDAIEALRVGKPKA